MERKSKLVAVRPLKKTDYLSWKNSILSIHPKKKNEWDNLAPKEETLTRPKFNALLKVQKKMRAEDTFYDFGIFLKDGTLVGRVTIMDVSRNVFQNAYLGYYIFNNHWGKGYGKEGVKLAIDIAFKDLGLHRLEAGIDAYNKRSAGLAKSLGMRKEGFSKNRLYLRGKWKSMSIYALTCEDLGMKWKPIN